MNIDKHVPDSQKIVVSGQFQGPEFRNILIQYYACGELADIAMGQAG